MGEVYRANDTRLDRAVAIKVLPPQFAADAERRERFEREARAISSLSHPNICSLFDVGRDGDVEYLVMELLEGQTLAERIARGPIPTEQLLRYGREIAGALDKAHRQKIIHRDLKPGNIFLTKNGVKLLDFGLAKSVQSAAVPADAPTVQQDERPLTTEGSLLGTVPYMSPEQLEGKEVDERSDIFSLGAILYEMATGKRPFNGRSQASLIASILEHDPQPIAELRPATPPSLERLIRACLEKNRDERVQTAHDAMLQLQWISENSGIQQRPRPRSAGRSPALRYLPLIAVAAIASVLGFWYGTQARTQAASPVEFTLFPPGTGGSFGVFSSISPDGTIVTPAREGGGDTWALWARELRSSKWRKIEGTEGGSDQMKPFFSPDGKSVAFFHKRQLQVVDLAGGAPREVCAAPYGVGGAWLDDGNIVFSPAFGQPMHRVPASGGTAEPVPGFAPVGKEGKQGWPVALPNGRFLFLQQARPNEPTFVFAASVSGGGPRRVLEATSLVGYSEPWLLFVRKGTLFAQRFDTDEMAIEGDPIRIASQVAHAATWIHSGASANGSVVAYPPAVAEDNEVIWVDRTGTTTGKVFQGLNIFYGALAPDDARLLYFREDQSQGITTLWIYDLTRGIESKLTSLNTLSAAWSPDGKLIAHDAGSGGTNRIYVQAADGSSPARYVGTTNGTNEFVGTWLSNGEVLVERFTAESFFDLWRVPVDGTKPAPFIATEFNEYSARLSPDGQWLAFESNRGVRDEIFVRNVTTGETVQISSGGGSGPEWSRHEIFFVGGQRSLYAVPYTATAHSLQPGAPRKLFELPERTVYDVTGDGQKILLSRSFGQAGQQQKQLNVVVGWKARLEGR